MKVAILGAGVSGLSSARFLLQNQIRDVHVFEAENRVGGMARSFEWHGFNCDLAPHRFFTENAETLKEITSLVPMRRVRRQSSIFVGGRWIQDPVNAAEVVVKFFPGRSFSIVWHYLFRRQRPEDNFEQMVLNKFGKGLHEFFFRPYSEKLFGIPADQISPVWGRKKIRVGGLRDMIMRKTRLYFREFYYPRKGGYGSICDRLYEDVRDNVRLNTRIVNVRPDPATGGYVCRFEHGGTTSEETFDVIVSSLPITQMATYLGVPLTLKFRPAKIVYLLIDRERVTENHWFYFADDHISINRVAEFRHFAGASLPAGRTVICCEITQTERFSIERTINELATAGVIRKDEVLDSRVEEMPFAYPVYHLDYEEQMQKVREMEALHPRIHHVGRNARFVHRDLDELYEDARQAVQRIIAPAQEPASAADPR